MGFWVLRQLACALWLGALGACVAPAQVTRPEPAGERHPHAEPELVGIRHRVEPGQNLFRIAKAYGLTVEELARANRISAPRALSVGQELFIPGARMVRSIQPASTEAGDPAPTAPASFGAVEPARAPPARPADRGSAPAPIVGHRGGTLEWPLRGVLYARFGRKGKEPHDGIDLAAPRGTLVKTAAPGTVLHAGEQPGYGRIVIVQHENGLITLYAHNHDLRVKTGQKVREGQVVATVGDSGRTSGPHLHFEVRKDGVPVDPLLHLGPVPSR